MFELRYMTGSKELIPTGWNSIDDDKAYPSLSSRNPQLQQQPEEASPNTDDQDESESSGEDGGSYIHSQFSSTRMVDESDEDESPKVRRVSLQSSLHFLLSSRMILPRSPG